MKLRLQRGNGISESIVELPKTRICVMIVFFPMQLPCLFYVPRSCISCILYFGTLASCLPCNSRYARIHCHGAAPGTYPPPQVFLTFSSLSSPQFILKLNHRCFAAGINTFSINLDCISFQSKLFLPVFFLLGRYACFL